MSDAQQIVELLRSDDPIPRDQVRTWMASDDLPTLAALYVLTDTGSARIEPALSTEEQTAMTRRYLMRCLEENPSPDEYVHGGFEAAWALAGWLKRWRQLDAAAAIRETVDALRSLYLRADETTRNRVLCGVLEHALEDPALRPYFASWQRHRDLREPYKLAVEWGVAHEKE